jgi:ABC-type branched-subunit amino acid transport system substrate-binding protein
LAAVPALTERAYRWVAGNRDHLGRFLSLALALTLVGCGSTVQAGSELTVHASLPLEGEQARAGRDALAGAELALEQAGGEAGGAPVTLVSQNDVGGAGPGAGWTQAQVAANARDAAEDSTAIAYLGELESDATGVSASITNEAGIPQVSPGPVHEELLRVPGGNDPPDDVQTTGERTLIALRGAGDPAAEPDGSFFAEFEDATGREASATAAYGFEAMALVLAAIDDADDPLSRESVLNALLATSDRESILGTYSIDSGGLAGIG